MSKNMSKFFHIFVPIAHPSGLCGAPGVGHVPLPPLRYIWLWLIANVNCYNTMRGRGPDACLSSVGKGKGANFTFADFEIPMYE